MSVKQSKKSSVTPAKGKVPAGISKPVSGADILCTLIILLYPAVDLIPKGLALDVMGPQWLYLAVVNIAAGGYVFYHNGEKIISVLFQQTLTRVYTALFLVAGISVFFAINPTEAWVNYANFITSILAFFNIAFLLHSRLLPIFKIVAQGISVFLLLQTVIILSDFFKDLGHLELDQLILNLTGNTGNKNILAASLVIKLPFLIYCIYLSGPRLKAFNIFILFLTTLSVFIINARAAYLGLLLQILLYATFCFLLYLKDKNIKQASFRFTQILLPVIGSLLVSQLVLGKAVAVQGSSTYSTVTERITTIKVSSNNNRIRLWAAAADYIKNHPLMGSGYGNWKLASMPYDRAYLNDLDHTRHAHNDFLEIAAETGILGGILFLGLFVIVLFYTIKVWFSNSHTDVRVISVIALMSMGGYFIDAVFNFPVERPVMQVFFALILAVTITAWLAVMGKDNPVTSSFVPKVFRFTTVILAGIAVYFSFQAYRSLRDQIITYEDFGTANPKHTWQEVDKLSDTPNLTLYNVPVNVVKAWYLYRGGVYDRAMDLLNKSTGDNPYSMANEMIKGNIFLQTGQLDSAYHYASKGFFIRPRNKAFYILLNDVAVLKNDPVTIKKAFLECIKYRNEAQMWDIYIKSLTKINYDQQEIQRIIDEAVALFPGDKRIQERKHYMLAVKASMAKDFKAAFAHFAKLSMLNPEDHTYAENAGGCLFALQRYAEALPYFETVIKSNAFSNGKSEYYKGLCLINLGKKAEGCSVLRMAEEKNYPGAKAMITANCQIASL